MGSGQNECHIRACTYRRQRLPLLEPVLIGSHTSAYESRRTKHGSGSACALGRRTAQTRSVFVFAQHFRCRRGAQRREPCDTDDSNDGGDGGVAATQPRQQRLSAHTDGAANEAQIQRYNRML